MGFLIKLFIITMACGAVICASKSPAAVSPKNKNNPVKTNPVTSKSKTPVKQKNAENRANKQITDNNKLSPKPKNVEDKLHTTCTDNLESNIILNFTTGKVNASKSHLVEYNKNQQYNLTNFDPDEETKVIIHGWINDDFQWIWSMTKEFLILDNFNVIHVIWPSNASFYLAAAVRTPLVGQQLASVITYLKETFNYSLSNFHLIGYSLGAHIAGVVGAKFNGTIGRISGLDPTGPGFDNILLLRHVKSSDAMFVDIIHTNAGFFKFALGTSTRSGHVDFYPNGGSEQPSCNLMSFLRKNDSIRMLNVLDQLQCDHSKAYDYYTESINSDCSFISHQCTDYKSYINQKCQFSKSRNKTTRIRMGYWATYPQQYIAEHGFYLQTNEDSPYCIDY